MAFDAVPGGDPRGPWCPKCAQPIEPGQPTTIMHFHEDPHGHLGQSGKRWHAECARPYWDKVTPALDALRNLWGKF
jgi:hypothetical protein